MSKNRTREVPEDVLTEAELKWVCGGVVVEKIGPDLIPHNRPKTTTKPGIGPV